MTDHSSYILHHLVLIQDLANEARELLAALPYPEDIQIKISQELSELAQTSPDEEFYTRGQDVIAKIVSGWPQLTPRVSRDLFWYFGGDCLQFMPDAEIALYQALDETFHASGAEEDKLDFTTLRAQIFGRH